MGVSAFPLVIGAENVRSGFGLLLPRTGTQGVSADGFASPDRRRMVDSMVRGEDLPNPGMRKEKGE